MRQRSIRATLGGLVAAGLLATVVLAVVLVAFTTWLHLVVETQSVAVESVRAAEEIEVHLLEAQRYSVLHGYFEDDTDYARRRDEAWSQVWRWLQVAEGYVTSSAEQAIVDELKTRVQRVYTLWEEARAEPSTTGQLATKEEIVATHEAIGLAIEAGDRLIAINLAEARRARESAARLDIVSDLLAFALTATIGGLLLMGIWTVRTLVEHPLQEVRTAIVRFGAGDLRSRAPVDGPTEIVEIAGTFNETADALEQGRRDQLAFVASVAHDLKNPLNALKLAAALAERGGPDAQARSIGLVLRHVNHLARMVDDLLDASRIEAGELELRLEEADVASIGREVIELFRKTSDRHELILSCSGPALARVDAARIYQVLTNLVSNALKYSPSGGRVIVHLEADEHQIRIAVKDHGIGISPDEQALVFKPFCRAAGGRGVASGAGLGLSVARRIVEAHGGSLALESRLGVGSTFTIRLPRRLGAESTHAASEEATIHADSRARAP